MRFKHYLILSILICIQHSLVNGNEYTISNEFNSVFKSLSSNLNKGIQYLNNEEFEKAKNFFIEKVRGDKNDDAANHYLGRTYWFLQNYDEAIEYLERAININNQIADYHFWLGQALGSKADGANIIKQAIMAPEILKEFERTVAIDSTHIRGHYGLASFYLAAPAILGGDIEKARNEAKIILKLDKPQGILISAEIYEHEDRLDQAEKAYDAYDKLYNDSMDNYSFYNGFGYFLLNQKKYAKAIIMFEKQVALKPNNANAHDSLGDGYRAAGRIKEAIAEYKKAAELDPQFESSLKKVQE